MAADLMYYSDQNETECRAGLIVPPEPSPPPICCPFNYSGPPGPQVGMMHSNSAESRAFTSWDEHLLSCLSHHISPHMSAITLAYI